MSGDVEFSCPAELFNKVRNGQIGGKLDDIQVLCLTSRR